MKKLTFIFTILIGLSQFSNAQIIDSLPYFKQEQIIKQTLKPFFNSVIYNEGVAALKPTLDPKFKPPTRGWIRDSMFHHIKSLMEVVEFQDGDDLFLSKSTILAPAMHKGYLDSNFVLAFIELPEGKKISKRGSYDPIGLLDSKDISPNMIIPGLVYKKIKNSPAKLNSFLGLVLVEKPNGAYKIYPKADKFIVLEESDMKGKGLLTDDGTLVLLVDKFLKSIRDNDKKTFRSVWDDDIVRSGVIADVYSLLIKLPEYQSKNLKLERIVTLDQLITWGGDVATFVAVYRLPDDMKASNLRAPTDIFNSQVWKQLGLTDLESQDRIVSGTPGFAKSIPQKIIPGPLIGTLLGEGISPENYISVILHKEPGTNNFNIGMPPSLK